MGNLGWCSNVRHLGNVLHVVLHAVGMNNEQQRPDAVSTFHGKGPHLIPKWDKIPNRAAWTTDPNSYVGSANDGLGDPHPDGYAEYDFDSIMHDSTEGGQAITVPANAAWLTGNRGHMTPDDIEALDDLYQCKRATEATTIPTAGETNQDCTAIKTGN